ncbi:MAG TPA: NAD(P)/FAD-dependent oxidoreductase [Thermoleophilaceae bacterium]|nr:NAD(P)/FAD-dependent oxidoreductase [Thermoleophilaceae bacterium]
MQADPRDPTTNVVIIGAGPAGLTAAYQLLTRYGITSTVLEAENTVGGISQTVERDGWRFDIGGHRFFTKVPEVEELWHEILPDGDFLLRPRMSRIYYDGKYYDYPLKAGNALRNLGLREAFLSLASYTWTRIRPPKNQNTLEGWIAARFGWRLYEHFFKTYNEKLWGVPVSSLPADFAAQRIKNLSLLNAALNALLPRRNQKDITSLIEEFQYPKYGPGMMWERCRDFIEANGCTVAMEARVVEVNHRDGAAISVVAQRPDGTRECYPCDHVVSSMPLSQLLNAIAPRASDAAVRAANDLRYRDFVTVALVVPEDAGFPDNWIYVHSPKVQVGRIQNFRSWSPYMVKDGRTCLGLEYFVFEGDETWSRTDEQLIEQGARELGILGLVDPDKVEAGYVVRMPKAYPFYDERYRDNVAEIVSWLNDHASNVHAVGRNGMHRYNNQDHSMYTAMLTAANIATGASHDVWSVNVEESYHEERAQEHDNGSGPDSGSHGTGRDAPVIPRRHYGDSHPVNQPAATP